MVYRFCVLILISLTPMLVSSDVLHSVGVARDSRNDTLRYIEHHQYLENGRHLVRYFSPELELIARKDIIYPDLPQHPLISQLDLGTGRQVRSSKLNNTLIMEVDDPSGYEVIELELTDELIIDAGFDAFIKTNWDELITVGKQSRPFAVAGQSRLLRIMIEAKSAGDLTGANFRIVPENWFARLFVGSLELVYDDARRLVSYTGYSNLSLASQNNRSVYITFSHYEMEAELEQPLLQWLPEK
jgi:hypothetical protein